MIPTLVGAKAELAWAGPAEVQITPPPLAVPVTVEPALQAQAWLGDRWSCSVSGALAQVIEVGAQLRLCRGPEHCAVYTVAEARPNDPDDVVRVSKAGRARLGASQAGFAATLRRALATTKLSDAQAQAQGEFVERIRDAGDHEGLVVLAPHGGGIELTTDRQARRVADRLAGADVSTWCCAGWKPGGGAFERWHVTSTWIHPASFPGLATLAQRRFAYALAFHGMSGEGVLIGGAGPIELKQMLCQAIAAALGGEAGLVTIASPGHSIGGSSPANVGNWLTVGGEGGIQIEQSGLVRGQYWRDVADAVASVYAGLV